MVALRARPRGARRSSWLFAVLRNALRQRLRSDARLRARDAERTRTAGPCAPATADQVAELEVQRRLLDFVSALPDAARQVVFLHFWHGLGVRQIADRLGVPAKTVYSRLERALVLLRSRLDEDRGIENWRSVLVPAPGAGALRPAPAGPAGLAIAGGVLLVKHKLFVVAAALVALAILVPICMPAPPGSAPVPSPSPPPPDRAGVPPPASSPSPSPPSRVAVELPAPAASAAEAPRANVVGRVLDLRGAPVPGVQIAFERRAGAGRDPEVPAVPSAADGSFTLPLPPSSGCLFASGGGFATVRRAWLDGTAPVAEPVVLVAPARDYSGTVVDPDGAPVARARVVVVVDAALVPVRTIAGSTLALPNDLGATDTDAAGTFHLDSVGWVPGSRVSARCDPFAGAELQLPEASTTDLLLRLGAPPADHKRVHGLVLDAKGSAVEGALVAVGGEAVRSRRDGTFTAAWQWVCPAFVRAVAPRLGAVTVPLVPGVDLPGWRAEQPIVLQFAAEPLALKGRVVDSAGAPAAGVRVWTPDLTFLGTVTRDEDGHEISGESSVEEQGAADWQRLSFATVTAEDGSFELRGVLPREYALFAIDPRTLAGAGPVAATAGTNCEVQLAASSAQRVSGRVLARDGTPLASVHVTPGRTFAWQRPARSPDPWQGCVMVPMGAAQLLQERGVDTDAEGNFAFDGLVVDGTWLHCDGEAVFASGPFQLVAGRPSEGLEVVVDARSTFRIVLDRSDEADAFSLARADGGHVPLYVRVENYVMSMGKVDLAGGMSPVAHSPAGEVTVVLWRGGKEVRRQAVRLPAGGVHDLRL